MKTIALLASIALAFLSFAFAYDWNLTADAVPLGWVGALTPPVLVMMAYVLGRIR